MKWGARLFVIFVLVALWVPAIALLLCGMAADPIHFKVSSIRLSNLYSSPTAADVAESLIKTVCVGLSVGILTSILATVVVWFNRGRETASRWCSFILLLPLLSPPLATAIAVGDMLHWFGLASGFAAVVIALSIVFAPVALILHQIRANQLSQHFVLCARNLGAGSASIFFSLFLRHQRITLISAGAVGMALAMGEPTISQHLCGVEPPFAALVMLKLSASTDGRLIANAATFFLFTILLLLVGALLTWIGAKPKNHSGS